MNAASLLVLCNVEEMEMHKSRLFGESIASVLVRTGDDKGQYQHLME